MKPSQKSLEEARKIINDAFTEAMKSSGRLYPIPSALEDLIALLRDATILECASIANHYMADQTDPAKALAASDIKIKIRALLSEEE